MINFFADYGIFLLKTITLILGILFLLSGMLGIAMKNKSKPKEKLVIKKLNDRYEEMKEAIYHNTLTKKEFKAFIKKQKKLEKEKQKATEKKHASKKRIFVLNFDGDTKATDVENLREEITAILTGANSNDEVLLKLESAGGVIHGYGLAASELSRIKERKIPLTISVDKVAASGGYLMACVANKIIAAPFAILGSIGVVAELPNFNELLKKHNINYEQITSGEHKRTLSMFGKNTEKGRKKMQADIEVAHALFKKFVKTNRPGIAIEKISTGEYWYGTEALRLKLIDSITTSDDYLLRASENSDIYEITYTMKKSLMDKCDIFAQKLLKIIN